MRPIPLTLLSLSGLAAGVGRPATVTPRDVTRRRIVAENFMVAANQLDRTATWASAGVGRVLCWIGMSRIVRCSCGRLYRTSIDRE